MRPLCAVFLVLLLSACTSAIVREQQDDLRLQQEVIRELERENNALRATNDLLRKDLISAKEREWRNEETLEICRENYLPLSNMTFDDLAPLTHVPITDILLSPESVIINVPDLREGIISATHSMEPFLDENDIVLERVPAQQSEIHEKDIIIFEQGGERIIHRVIEIGHDENGWYAWTKGDNNTRRDPEKVRFSDVRGIVVGVIY